MEGQCNTFPFEEGIEVNGQTVSAVVEGFALFKKIPSDILLALDLGRPGARRPRPDRARGVVLASRVAEGLRANRADHRHRRALRHRIEDPGVRGFSALGRRRAFRDSLNRYRVSPESPEERARDVRYRERRDGRGYWALRICPGEG